MRKYLPFLLVFCVSVVLASDCSTVLVGVKDVGDGFEGVLANLTVYVRPGSGNVWVDTMPLSKIETQVSARLAREVACELLGLNCSGSDFYYVIRSDYAMVGGPSAGAAMTVCTLAALLNKSVYPDVAITGTINPDGSVGSVGSVLDKAGVLKGYRLFLVPQDSFINDSGLGLSIVGVSDVLEAFKHFTGYEIVYGNVSVEDVVNVDYFNAMKMMDEELLVIARMELSGNDSRVLLNDSESYYRNGSYYSSASYSVRSLIYSFYDKRKSYANDTLYVEGLINNISGRINSSKREFLSNVKIDHLYDLESLAITMERFREAESLLDEARGFLFTGLGDALFSACFAEARLVTAGTWSLLLDYFSDSKIVDFDLDSVRPLVIMRLESARNSIAYSQTVIDPALLINAESHLSEALSAYYDGDLFYALFEALKARTEANLMMELRGVENVSLRIDFKRESAIRAIENVMQRGYLPLSSLSFLEYSDTFRNDPVQEIVFLAYSKEFASLSSSLNDYAEYSDEYSVVKYSLQGSGDYDFLTKVLLVILGFVLGLVAVTGWVR